MKAALGGVLARILEVSREGGSGRVSVGWVGTVQMVQGSFPVAAGPPVGVG